MQTSGPDFLRPQETHQDTVANGPQIKTRSLYLQSLLHVWDFYSPIGLFLAPDLGSPTGALQLGAVECTILSSLTLRTAVINLRRSAKAPALAFASSSLSALAGCGPRVSKGVASCRNIGQSGPQSWRSTFFFW